MFYNFELPNNNNKAETMLFLLIGVIIEVDAERLLAKVNTNHGPRDNVRICLPHYSAPSGIFALPKPGDICTLAITSENETFMLGYYSLNPKKELSSKDRPDIKPHSYIIRTAAGDSIKVSQDVYTPEIVLKSTGDKTVKLELTPKTDVRKENSFSIIGEKIGIRGSETEDEKKLDLFVNNAKINIVDNNVINIELSQDLSIKIDNLTKSVFITAPSIIISGNISFGASTGTGSSEQTVNFNLGRSDEELSGLVTLKDLKDILLPIFTAFNALGRGEVQGSTESIISGKEKLSKIRG